MKFYVPLILCTLLPAFSLFSQNVGVDVASPVEKLDVLGAIRIGNTSNTNAGTMRWTGTNFEGYNGSAWVNLGGGGTVSGTGTATRLAFWSGASALSSSANLYWDNTNSRLGVGLNNPSGVISAGSAMGNKVLAYDDGTNAAGLGIQSGFLQVFTSNNSSNIVFGYGSSGSFTENVRFSGSGNVGIGTTTPQTRFHVNGKGAFGDAVTASNTARALNLISSDAVMRVLRVSPSINTAGPAIELVHRTTPDGADTDYWDFYVDANGLGIRDRAPSDNTRIAIDNTGNIGMGTTTPGAKLEVAGQVKITGGTPALNQVLTSDANGLATWEPAQGDNLGNHIATANLQLNNNWLSNDGGSEGIRVDNNGNVGVGQTPGTAYLDVTGTNGGTTSLQLRSGNVGTGGTSNQVTFGYNGTENYRHSIKTRHQSGGTSNAIDFYVWDQPNDIATTIGTLNVMSITGLNNGSVGIGITGPSAQLHTTGSVRFAGLTAASQTSAVMTDGSGNLSTRALNPVAFSGTLANHTAGTGLSGSVYDGSAAQTWSVAYGTTAGTAVQGNQAATIIAGNGLTGGISADALGDGFTSSLAVGAGTAIQVNADDIAVKFDNSTITTNGSGQLQVSDVPASDADYIQNQTVGNNFAAGQSASIDVTGNAEIGGTLNLNGNVGIGTTSPVVPLEIVKGGGNSALFRNTNAASYTGLRIYNDQNTLFRSMEIDYSGSSYAASLMGGGVTGESGSIATTGAYPLMIGTSNTLRIMIKADGNVGISSNNPGYRLDVNGTFNIPADTWATGNGKKAFRDSYFGYSAIYRAIQIGEVGATQALALGVDLTGNTNGQFSGNEIVIPNNRAIIAVNGTVNQNYVGVLRVGTDNKIYLGGADYQVSGNMTIETSTGNVGIGSATPGSKLDVSGNAKATNGYLVGAANSGVRIEYGVIDVTANGDYAVGFATAFTTPPVVTLTGSPDVGYRESFGVMQGASSRPTTTGFYARLVDDNAAYSRGKIYWMAIGK